MLQVEHYQERAKLSNTESILLPFATALRTRLSCWIWLLWRLLILPVNPKLGAGSALRDQQMRKDRNTAVWHLHGCHNDMQDDKDNEPHQPQRHHAKQPTRNTCGALLSRGLGQHTDARNNCKPSPTLILRLPLERTTRGRGGDNKHGETGLTTSHRQTAAPAQGARPGPRHSGHDGMDDLRAGSDSAAFSSRQGSGSSC